MKKVICQFDRLILLQPFISDTDVKDQLIIDEGEDADLASAGSEASKSINEDFGKEKPDSEIDFSDISNEGIEIIDMPMIVKDAIAPFYETVSMGGIQNIEESMVVPPNDTEKVHS